MKIYTKKGDQGTSKIKNQILSKDDLIFHVLGSLDELGANLGIFVSYHNIPLELKDFIMNIQRNLVYISSIISGFEINWDIKQAVIILENKIDEIDSNNIPLHKFILQGGSKISAYIHLLRVKTRSSERNVVSLNDKSNADILIYLNRLSDYFFVLARMYNNRGEDDILV